VAIVCNEILQGLANRRVIELEDVERALDSPEIHTALGGWGHLVGHDTPESRLDRIIVYATIDN